MSPQVSAVVVVVEGTVVFSSAVVGARSSVVELEVVEVVGWLPCTTKFINMIIIFS